MDKIKQQFLEENKFNDSIEKSYKMIFKKIDVPLIITGVTVSPSTASNK